MEVPIPLIVSARDCLARSPARPKSCRATIVRPVLSARSSEALVENPPRGLTRVQILPQCKLLQSSPLLLRQANENRRVSPRSPESRPLFSVHVHVASFLSDLAIKRECTIFNSACQSYIPTLTDCYRKVKKSRVIAIATDQGAASPAASSLRRVVRWGSPW